MDISGKIYRYLFIDICDINKTIRRARNSFLMYCLKCKELQYHAGNAFSISGK